METLMLIGVLLIAVSTTTEIIVLWYFTKGSKMQQAHLQLFTENAAMQKAERAESAERHKRWQKQQLMTIPEDDQASRNFVIDMERRRQDRTNTELQIEQARVETAKTQLETQKLSRKLTIAEIEGLCMALPKHDRDILCETLHTIEK